MHPPQAIWRRLLNITKRSLPEPPVQSIGSPPGRGTAHIYTQVLFKNTLLFPSKKLSISTTVLFPESGAHSLLLKEIRMNSHILYRLFYEEEVKGNQRRQLCARKKYFIIPNFLLHPIRLWIYFLIVGLV